FCPASCKYLTLMPDPSTSPTDMQLLGLDNADRGRYAVAVCDGGCVLLDLDSGAFFEVNPVAAEICRALSRGESTKAIARSLVAAYGIPLDRASRDVEEVLKALRRSPAPTGNNPIRFEEEAGGFLLRWQGREVCTFDANGAALIRWPGTPDLLDPA